MRSMNLIFSDLKEKSYIDGNKLVVPPELLQELAATLFGPDSPQAAYWLVAKTAIESNIADEQRKAQAWDDWRDSIARKKLDGHGQPSAVCNTNGYCDTCGDMYVVGYEQQHPKCRRVSQ